MRQRTIDRKRLVELHEMGLSTAKIANELDASTGTVGGVIYRMRQKGELPPPPEKPAISIVRKMGVNMGPIMAEMETHLTRKEWEFLMDRINRKTPRLCDVLVELVRERASMDVDQPL